MLQVEPGGGDRGLAAVAHAQCGVAHRRQLATLGISRGSVTHRLSRGRLHRVLPSVLAVGHAHLEPRALSIAALLHAGDDAVLSHGTAGAIWGLVTGGPEVLHVTLIGRRVRDQPSLKVHRVAMLDLRDARLCRGLPVTAPARTLIDFAAQAAPTELAAALAQARVARLINDRDLYDAMGRAPGRTGVARLRELLARPEGTALTRSELERQLLSLIRRGGLPLPLTNTVVNGHEVDAVWLAHKLILEVDGWAFHGDRRAFETDRARDQDHVAHGYRVVRITWRQLEREPLLVLARIAQALAAPRERRPVGRGCHA